MSDQQDGPHTGVPFTYFCSLVREIASIAPTTPRTRRAQRSRVSSGQERTALNVFKKWVENLRLRFSPLLHGTTAICFKFLFPEEDWRRRYDIQEKTMAKLLQECYGINEALFDSLSLEESSGCLGEELKVVLNQRTSEEGQNAISPLTISDVSELLDQLAASSPYSDDSIRHKKFPQEYKRGDLMRKLFRTLSPHDASVLTQIILKDLKPLLYPLNEFHYTTALTTFDSASVKMLTLQQAMKAWDDSNHLLRFYGFCCCIDKAGAFAENPTKSLKDVRPSIGSMIAVPKSQKGTSYQQSLDYFYKSKLVWGETKYDGERVQGHVQIGENNRLEITLFSKSKRDSTSDRCAVHNIIFSALGLDKPGRPRRGGKRQVKRNIIFDAEMVAFKNTKIEDFWRIKSLVANTSKGSRRRWRSHKKSDAYTIMNCDESGFSLGLVFFDVMYLDDNSLCWMPYSERRSILESLIQVTPGKAILSSRYPIDMTSPSHAEKELERIFQNHIDQHEEGLVLKAEQSRYNDWNIPWVKLKKDYMPDAKDHIKMVIFAASWEKSRGRSLRVAPSTYTTFYIGGLAPGSSLNNPKPFFHIYFSVSYGLTREDLEELNFLIRNSDTVPFTKSTLAKDNLPYQHSSFPGLNPAPTILLRTPLLAEMFGAGFTKEHNSAHYQPRFPRITKVYRPSERSWREGLTLEALHKIACKSVGREEAESGVNSQDLEVERVVSDMWAQDKKKKPVHAASLSANSPEMDIVSAPCVTPRPSSPIRKRKTREGRATVPIPEAYAEWFDDSDSDRHQDISPEGSRKRPRREDTSFTTEFESTIEEPEPVTPVLQPLTVTTNIPAPGLISPVSLEKPRMSSKKQKMCVEQSPSLCKQTSKSFKTVKKKKALYWFAPTDTMCEVFKSWKEETDKEERRHTLNALLHDCGGKQGIIVIDECDSKTKQVITQKLNAEIVNDIINLLMFSLLRSSSVSLARRFSTSTVRPDRAVVYAIPGPPTEVLRVLTYPDLPPPPPNTLNIKFLLAPINPADINVVEGVYPTKPSKLDALVFDDERGTLNVGGNEGLAKVTALGQTDASHGLKVGDWVIMTRQQAGTWATHRNVEFEDVAKVPGAEALTETQAATLTVNPPTAYNMLNDFVDLKPGDWVIQNGANSAVGQAVIQIAKSRGLKTINLIRDRPDLDQLVSKLQSLGADHVLTYDQLADKSVREKIKAWTGGKPIRLGLNCVGGKDTTSMARFLGNDAHLVSYGAMARQPLSLPVSLFIFKNLTCHGFWQSRWYLQRSLAEREGLMQKLVDLMKEKKLDTPEHEIVQISARDTDEEATVKIRKTLEAMSEGRYGKKVLLKIESE
ncbi:Enoyl-[acyl-carrier-protein] reductase, mitochondrial [Psilocybe cubensis]|uniref:Enoyl-[acyl-carrier-protein] reductase, mitochondrial n=2 Tax=Psilocybe cubensis TaxID=181762 RepID=A0ACB8GVP3_PSICU|nr:Enoyl-[acyl-carrier-protein] reductase, mitochondrial [Psilocybe cubensis]KAH9479593.1 Enoyl-[acyl-carrier-protein] reductase, mitochondrial [Psilocybe cubensis]